MNEGTLCTMHQTLAVRGSFRGERAHVMTVDGEWCVAGHCSWRAVLVTPVTELPEVHSLTMQLHLSQPFILLHLYTALRPLTLFIP
ncbi:hypothetical protein E2C01_033757 [Portunus trituberculatus]|uniref:Uncharacterized protein n=1 Tax=Portunus trituberculatus TaxID=210409 RepID=A0A5B7F0Y4_PORTR|nr:hypothetical protein [Portunus trituberculatus]